ncbi:MAG TPA: RNA-binding protein [Noviherbaspirillum sp.]|nr:RNA-binding protein [Noviherbaspirillum sp.]
MGELMIGNVDDSASDEEIKEFLVKYGFPPFDEIEHMPGDGSRPAVLLTFNDAGAEALRSLQPRINNVYWKNRMIDVQVMTERFS